MASKQLDELIADLTADTGEAVDITDMAPATLAEALGVSEATAQRLQSLNIDDGDGEAAFWRIMERHGIKRK